MIYELDEYDIHSEFEFFWITGNKILTQQLCLPCYTATTNGQGDFLEPFLSLLTIHWMNKEGQICNSF